MFSKVAMAIYRAKKPNSLFHRRSSTVQAMLDSAVRSRQLPKEISIQILDERHDLNQIRNLLARAFVVNNEPIVNVLGEIYYPSITSTERIPLIEERFKSLFSEESMLKKVEQGLSFVAVRDNDPSKLVSVAFAEKYTRGIYKGESTTGDPLCQTGLKLMWKVHEKAIPILDEYSLTRTIIFGSHAATHPKYRALGIVENLFDVFRSRLIDEHPAVYCMLTSHRLANFLIQRYGFHVISEVFYKDYEDNGQKVFEQLSEHETSAKALLICL